MEARVQLHEFELVELKRNLSNAWCCGAGGGVKSQFPDLAVEISKDGFGKLLIRAQKYY